MKSRRRVNSTVRHLFSCAQNDFSPMKRIRITNDRTNFVTLWLEPWGADFGMAPTAEFDIVAGDAGNDFYFHVLSDDKGFKVYAEGQVTEIGVFQNGAELSCGHARREETW